MKSLSLAKSSILGLSSSSTFVEGYSGGTGVVASSTCVVFSSGVGSDSGSLGDSSAGVGVTGSSSG